LSLRASIRPELPVVFVTAYAEHAWTPSNWMPRIPAQAGHHGRLVKALAKIRAPWPAGRRRRRPWRLRHRYAVQAGSGWYSWIWPGPLFRVEDQVVWAFAGERFRTRWKTLARWRLFSRTPACCAFHRHLLIRPEAVLGSVPRGGQPGDGAHAGRANWRPAGALPQTERYPEAGIADPLSEMVGPEQAVAVLALRSVIGLSAASPRRLAAVRCSRRSRRGITIVRAQGEPDQVDAAADGMAGQPGPALWPASMPKKSGCIGCRPRSVPDRRRA